MAMVLTINGQLVTSANGALIGDVQEAEMPEWQWATQLGASHSNNCNSRSATGIGIDSLGNSYILGSDNYEMGVYTGTVVKLNEVGQWQWTAQVDGCSFANIAVNRTSGYCYVIGVFNGTVNFGSATLTSSGGSEIFVAKLSSSGSWVWAVQAGNAIGDDYYGLDVAVNTSGTCYITGYFHHTITLGSTTLTSAIYSNVFVAQINALGQWQWAVQGGGSNSDGGACGISLDASGNSYITGYFEETAAFGSTNLTSAGTSDIFVAKLNSSGAWQWAVQVGGTDYDGGLDIAVNASGDCYVAGYFAETATFGSTILTSPGTSGGSDIFVSKLNTSGEWQWAVQAGDIYSDHGSSIAVDTSGNCYVAGDYYGEATFGSTTLTNSNGDGHFVSKLNTSGIWQWALEVNAPMNAMIAADSSGNCYITSGFNETATFGTTTLTSIIMNDTFVAKLNTSGEWQWAVKAHGAISRNNAGYGIAVDSLENCYVTGDFEGAVCKFNAAGQLQWTAQGSNNRGNSIAIDSSGNSYIIGDLSYGTTTFGNINLTNISGLDIFVAKLNASGEWQWAVQVGNSYGNGIAVDSSGNCYVTGYFEGTTAFGSNNLTSISSGDIYVAKLNTSGEWQWAVQVGETNFNSGCDIVVNDSGDCYVTGYFSETATFGSISLTGAGINDIDIFVAKLNSLGTWQWAVQAGWYNYEQGNGIALDPSGNCYITGYFLGEATFGITTLTSIIGHDIFVAKLNASGEWQWAVQAGGINSLETGYGISADPSGNCYIIGVFTETATFGTTNITSNGGNDIFVAKLNTFGEWQWAVQAGGAGNDDHGWGIRTNTLGDCYVTGAFTGTATFGSNNLTSAGDYDIFVAKLG